MPDISPKILATKGTVEWQSLPPTITFQSLVDSTVHTGTLVSELYIHLPENGSELILFDINRASDLQHFVIDGERTTLDQLQKGQATSFGFTLVTNKSGETRSVQARTRLAGEDEFSAEDMNGHWPHTIQRHGSVVRCDKRIQGETGVFNWRHFAARRARTANSSASSIHALAVQSVF